MKIYIICMLGQNFAIFSDKDDLNNDLFLLECFNKPSEWLF